MWMFNIGNNADTKKSVAQIYNVMAIGHMPNKFIICLSNNNWNKYNTQGNINNHKNSKFNTAQKRITNVLHVLASIQSIN